ncbi:hypothetical protein H0H81_003256 [Sphagnurus paluster]|uniref:Uncharacterized protein n=1 Tax=Sphagnurus paluster TaxID=117069 RepID=A0A9P7GLJ7_9AGAR|nr:hypothetical protein H0H81_003256 [Sphagnurus paluster]
MKSGAAFEMLEEDLFFPGKLIDSDSDSERGSDSEHRTSSFSSTFGSHSNSDTNLESVSESTAPSSDDMSPPTPTTATLPSTPSRSNSPTERVAINEEKEAEELLAQVIAGYSITNEEASADMDIAIPDVPSPTIQPQVTNPKSLITQPLGSSFAGSAVSLIMSSVGSAAPPDSLYETTPITIEPNARGTRPRGYSLAASLSVPDSESHTTSSADVIPPVPLLLRTVPKPPANPRDHSLLESIYMKLLESRFINISPLALLANSIGLTFKDLRTHPPLQYRFPAIHHKPRCANDGTEKSVDYPEREDLSDSDDARDAILPSPVPRSIKKRNSRRISTQSFEEEVHISEDNRYVDVRALMRHSSPYITLDEARASALSPSTKSMFPGISSAKLQRGSFLPNTTMNLDLKTLNLHLALRASEILACSESMWEWVLEYQGKDENKPNRTAVRPHRSGSGSVEMAPRTSVTSMTSHDDSQNSFRKSLLDLTRDEFNGLLSKFEMDMRDKCGLGNALEERFSWPSAESTPSPERKIFETACEKWDKWEMEQEANHHQRIPAGPYIATRPSPTAQQFSDSNDYISHGHGRGKKRVSTSSGSTLLPPTRRMSRAMRVFVAWNP